MIIPQAHRPGLKTRFMRPWYGHWRLGSKMCLKKKWKKTVCQTVVWSLLTDRVKNLIGKKWPGLSDSDMVTGGLKISSENAPRKRLLIIFLSRRKHHLIICASKSYHHYFSLQTLYDQIWYGGQNDHFPLLCPFMSGTPDLNWIPPPNLNCELCFSFENSPSKFSSKA